MALSIPDEQDVAAAQKLAGHPDRLVQQSAGIIAEIKDEAFRFLPADIGKRIAEIFGKSLAEAGDTEVNNGCARESSPSQVVELDGSTDDRDLAHLAGSGVENAQFDCGTGPTRDVFDHPGERPAGDVILTDFQDDVTGAQTGTLSRRAVDRGDDDHVTLLAS